MHDLAEQLLPKLTAIWRHRWYAVVFAWAIALVGWIVVYQMPDRYEAGARVYVDTQSVLKPLLTGLAVHPDVDQMVTIMSRTLISRSNLERVIRMADLEKTDENQGKMIERLAKTIAIKRSGTDNIYTISYVDQDPQAAKKIVQSLLTLFLEEIVGDKRKDTESAGRFIDEQLDGYRTRLQAAEKAITEFKRRNLGLMPGQGPGYYARLDDARTIVNRAELELKEAENARDSIKKQLASESERLALPGDADTRQAGNPPTELDARIRALEQRLDSLRLSYTEQHPDIVAIIPMIARLREQKEAEVKLKEAEAKLKGPLPISAQAKSPVYQQLTISLATAEANVAVMKTRVAEYRQRYAELQGVANAAPQVEAEFTQLTRDYEVNRTRYDELLKRRESAQISGDMEANDAMAFRVIDSPHVPLKPIAPNRPLLMTMVLLAALGGGLGGAFLISQIWPTINDERRMKEVSGLQVLGTVVMTRTDSQKAGRIRGLIAFLISFASLLSAYVAIMAVLVLTAARA